MTEKRLATRVDVRNFNKALDDYYGHLGCTYSDFKEASAALIRKGYTKEGERWIKHGKEAFITPLRDAKFDIGRNIIGWRRIGVLVTYGAELIGHLHCRLREVK